MKLPVWVGMQVCLAASAPSANPLLIDGQAVAWPDDAWPLPIADADLDWRRAAAGWTAGAAGFTPVGPASVGPDGVVTLAEWGATRWAQDVGDPALLGFTLVTHEDGLLRDADVVLNVERYLFSDTPDVRRFHRPTTLAHELGHVLALGHADAVEALMHAAQEPGEVGAIDAGALAALAEVSTCCARFRRPALVRADGQRITFAQVEPDDVVRAHGASVADLTVDARGQVDVPAGTQAIEIWTRAGQGGVFAVSAADAGLDAEPTQDAGPSADAQSAPPAAGDQGCRQQAGPGAPQLWILGAMLPLLGVWRRR